jgi:predicted transcriptional regulator
MKKKLSPMDLGQRERQILAFLYRNGRATAAEVKQGIADPPGYSGVRAVLRILEEKGYVEHEKEGMAYVFKPTQSARDAGRDAMNYLVQAFFGGSAEKAVAALLDTQIPEISDADLDRLAALIERAKQ